MEIEGMWRTRKISNREGGVSFTRNSKSKRGVVSRHRPLVSRLCQSSDGIKAPVLR